MIDAQAWAAAAQERRDDELRGHGESVEERRAHYFEVLDDVARLAQADSSLGYLHREARRLIGGGRA